MKRLTFLVLVAACSFQLSLAGVSTDHLNALCQVKDKFLNIRINKYDDEKMELLLTELRSHEEKISSAAFYPANRTLLVYYKPFVAVDNICEIVNKYFQDFDKVGGTDL